MENFPTNQQHTFSDRHIGPNGREIESILQFLEHKSLDELTAKIVPKSIQNDSPLPVAQLENEAECLKAIKTLASKNKVYKSYIGMGYNDTHTPCAIQRNLLENPGWYTQYTPYQPEISQGRLESLFNFQTMIKELTKLPVANASLLDEATAAAEAMILCYRNRPQNKSKVFYLDTNCHPQTKEVVIGRAEALQIRYKEVSVMDESDFQDAFGCLIQNPDTYGELRDLTYLAKELHSHNALLIAACDLLSLALVTPPGEMGADFAVGSAQRFGVSMGFGGPHAGYIACSENFKRKLPGRIVGISKDRLGKPAFRLALQTREQHIRREKATSNICTAQALLANMAAMYGVYHGPQGLKSIALDVHQKTEALRAFAEDNGFTCHTSQFFDTITLSHKTEPSCGIHKAALLEEVNLRPIDHQRFSISLAETTTQGDLLQLAKILSGKKATSLSLKTHLPENLQRQSAFMEQEVFHRYQTETELMRYMKSLENKDLSLTDGMIPLGSCTMKLNAAVEMLPICWPEFAKMHPFAPKNQTEGYLQLNQEIEDILSHITGFKAVSLQPNSGAQGEYAGLRVIKAYHQSRGQEQRDVCLIPSSAHGTNPASAALVGMNIKIVKCDSNGNVDLADLQQKATEAGHELAALMITYPSTHGVFEEGVREICSIIHKNGGQVYLDGANLNAQVGLCKPGEYGADVCHMNLHKTFCIPHGGGGPGAGPIGVAEHLVPFLPGHQVGGLDAPQGIQAVSAAPYGSANLYPIVWTYLKLMGPEGLKKASQVAILNANYIAQKLSSQYDVLYRDKNGFVAHECIVDLRSFKKSHGVEVHDFAKRLMDYGFHAPTVSFPVAGTIMIEPTESEALKELDRFCEAMLSMKKELDSGKTDLFLNAPHTLADLIAADWPYSYSREEACLPVQSTRTKFWPASNRIDEAFGDRNFCCSW